MTRSYRGHEKLSVIFHDYAQCTFRQGQKSWLSRAFGWWRRNQNYGQSGRAGAAIGTWPRSRAPHRARGRAPDQVGQGNRHGHRDATMILIGFRHGFRVSELCDLQWSSIEFQTGTMHVRRAKGGQEATHPLLGDELRALRELKRQSASLFVFASERGGPFTPSGFAKLLARAGDEAKIGLLRHACGYALANKGIDTRTSQAYLGHRSINSTTRYAKLAPGRFKNIWGKA
jgi:integrase